MYLCFSSQDQISDEVKQNIAKDMNLSETAFVSRRWSINEPGLPAHGWTIRWFTPAAEAALCGHATLASARVLFTQVMDPVESNEPNSIEFYSKYHGILGASMTAEDDGLITLNFPAYPTKPLSDFPEFDEHKEWIDQVITETLRSPRSGEAKGSSFTPIDIQYSKEVKYLLLRVNSRDDLLSIIPNYEAMAEIDTKSLFVGIIVTAQGEGDSAHFYSRFFSPWYGINEDPVTGSAHTMLAPYWKNILEKDGETAPQFLIGEQLSARRGGVQCELTNGGSFVHLSGNSRITLKGEFIM